MAYLFKQKLNIMDLAGQEFRPSKILIYEPEEYLAALYQHHLRLHSFEVMHCLALEQAKLALTGFEPDVFVFCADADNASSNATVEIWKLLRSLGADFPKLRLVSTGLNSSNDLISQLMRAGVLGHINRKLSRPQDLAVVVKSVLQQV